MALCGRDAMLMATKDGALRLVTANRQQSSSARPNEPPPLSILGDTLERWKSGRPPVTDVRDCWRAMRLADEAYRHADRVG
jgi:hypothetical protein